MMFQLDNLEKKKCDIKQKVNETKSLKNTDKELFLLEYKK